ncbi:MAG TPA: hypothetical protein VIS94_01345 [Desulfomonilia bacterium]
MPDIKPYVTRFDFAEHCANGLQDSFFEETAQKYGRRAWKMK